MCLRLMVEDFGDVLSMIIELEEYILAMTGSLVCEVFAVT